nr:squalene synthase-like [Nicotiana tomentosiformis]
MGIIGDIVRHPNEICPLMKLLLIAKLAEKQILSKPHWSFCYLMLRNISRSFSLVIQQLPLELRDAGIERVSMVSGDLTPFSAMYNASGLHVLLMSNT